MMQSVDLENLADEWEEQQTVLAQLAEDEKFQVGNLVILVDPKMQALFGKGAHIVEGFISNEIVTIGLWHGKRSLNVANDEISKLDETDFTSFDVEKALEMVGDEIITETIVTNALVNTYNLPNDMGSSIAIEYLNYTLP